MRYELSTAPSGDVVDMADVLDHLRVSDESEYTYLAALVDRAVRWVERRTQRQLLTATWKLYLDAFPAEIQLRKLPVASVTSIQYVDLDGDTQTLSATYYQTDYKSADRPGRIMPAYGYSWPNTRSSIYNAVTVTFTAGYGAASAVPETIKQAIMMLAGHWYDHREAVDELEYKPVPYAVDNLLSLDEWGYYH